MGHDEKDAAVRKGEEDAIYSAPTATSSGDRQEKTETGSEGVKEPEIAKIVHAIGEGQPVTAEQHERVAAHYGRRAEADHLAPSSDVEYILDQIAGLSEAEAAEILVDAVARHADDPNFPAASLARMRLLVAGPKAYGRGNADADAAAPASAGAETTTEEDYAFDLKTEAAIYHHHSPYPEVRSVTRPGDDPTTPVETARAYFLGLSFMAGITAVNTFFSPRQPAIDISPVVMQLLIAPCGLFLARVLPDWGVVVRGARHSLNPGPWSFKEQVFCSIIFTIANNAGNTYYVYLVQRLPQYLGNAWVTFGYEIVLALSVNFFGMGFAGLLRRFVIYPVGCLFPEVFPALALNRALVEREPAAEKKGENVHGWTVSRYRFFLACALLMFGYFWVPNTLFKALRSFNWMTWIAPQNFTLAMVTGFWGGMGYNPLATFDWNVAGKGALTTPFFSFAQQYFARFVSGLIIIAMYWSNMYWSAYMPINSNEGKQAVLPYLFISQFRLRRPGLNQKKRVNTNSPSLRQRRQEVQRDPHPRHADQQHRHGRLPRVRPALLLGRQRVRAGRLVRLVPADPLQRVDPALGVPQAVGRRDVARPGAAPPAAVRLRQLPRPLLAPDARLPRGARLVVPGRPGRLADAGPRRARGLARPRALVVPLRRRGRQRRHARARDAAAGLGQRENGLQRALPAARRPLVPGQPRGPHPRHRLRPELRRAGCRLHRGAEDGPLRQDPPARRLSGPGAGRADQHVCVCGYARLDGRQFR